VDFGIASFGFLHSRTITLANTSQIPMKFTLRIPKDGEFMQREFGLTPSSGTLLPKSKMPIKLDFVPETVKKYTNDYQLLIECDGVGQGLISLPIIA